jgi:hypothetical protein
MITRNIGRGFGHGDRVHDPLPMLRSVAEPNIWGPITDEGVVVGGAFDRVMATGIMPIAHRGAGVLASRRS